jgi:hypothetical protein
VGLYGISTPQAIPSFFSINGNLNSLKTSTSSPKKETKLVFYIFSKLDQLD